MVCLGPRDPVEIADPRRLSAVVGQPRNFTVRPRQSAETSSFAMTETPIRIAGIPLPSAAPIFLLVVAIHVVAGLAAVITGAVAMFSAKGPGRHPSFGSWYYRSVVLTSLTMGVLSAMRWTHDYHLFILGAFALTAVVTGKYTAPSRIEGQARMHITAMGLSYVFLLTAFYVDNGPNLPVWRSLPHLTYWVLPILVGAPLIVRALLTHPVVQRRAITVDAARPNHRWRGP